MRLNQKGKDLIHKFEGCKLEAYLCPANVWTIGFGNTFYENIEPVEDGDKITRQRAIALSENILKTFEDKCKRLIKQPLTENQFSAIVSFAYNVGVGNLSKSTLLRKVNANPKDISIALEFLRWNKANGKVLNGLVARRKAESDLYFQN